MNLYRSHQAQWNGVAVEGNKSLITEFYDREDIKGREL